MYTTVRQEGPRDDAPHPPPRHPTWGHPGTGRATLWFRLASAVLRTARAYAELSQRELAERSGVSATIARIEANRGSPRWSSVERCVRACGCRFALITDDDEVIDYTPLVIERDRAGRHYPAHLKVWQVTSPIHWWNGGIRHTRTVLLSDCPPFSFTKYRRQDRGDLG